MGDIEAAGLIAKDCNVFERELARLIANTNLELETGNAVLLTKSQSQPRGLKRTLPTNANYLVGLNRHLDIGHVSWSPDRTWAVICGLLHDPSLQIMADDGPESDSRYAAAIRAALALDRPYPDDWEVPSIEPIALTKLKLKMHPAKLPHNVTTRATVVRLILSDSRTDRKNFKESDKYVKKLATWLLDAIIREVNSPDHELRLAAHLELATRIQAGKLHEVPHASDIHALTVSPVSIAKLFEEEAQRLNRSASHYPSHLAPELLAESMSVSPLGIFRRFLSHRGILACTPVGAPSTEPLLSQRYEPSDGR